MEAVFDKIPNVVTMGFAAIGFIFLGSKVISYIQLLLSLFVLSGKSVRLSPRPQSFHSTMLISENSYALMGPKGHGQ